MFYHDVLDRRLRRSNLRPSPKAALRISAIPVLDLSGKLPNISV
jgi:hypothetical protein